MSSADETTRDRILAAARGLLEEQPGAGPSMGQIAQRAGISRQAVYLHFTDRAELLLELTRAVDAAERTADRQRRVDAAPTARAALTRAVALQALLKPRLHGVATALDALRRSDPDAQAAWQEREQARLGRCEQVVRRLAAENELAPQWSVPDAARLMWAVTSQHVWEDLVLNERWSSRRYTRHITQLLERSLLRGCEDPNPNPRRS